MTFLELGVSDNLQKALELQNISSPTQIQRECYQPISDGKDFVGCSQTGSGKTIAYLLPLIRHIDEQLRQPQILILVPTQELAIQVQKQAMFLLENAQMNVHAAFFIGEGSLSRQLDSLKTKPAVVIGTPSRIKQLIHMKKLHIHQVKSLVIDEADKLMTKTYYEDLLFIRKSLMKRTQVLMFSASINQKALHAANHLMCDPIVLDLTKKEDAFIPDTIRHIFVLTNRRERIETLRKIIHALDHDKTIIFINTKYDLQEALQKMKYHHYAVGALAGIADKQAKKKAMDDFSAGRIKYLLATDVAARGLQMDNINAVINLNLPEEETEYLHRAGRCGRNGNPGLCVSVITENELPKIKKYQKKFRISILEKRLYHGKLVAK